jgi:hypothetical protein
MVSKIIKRLEALKREFLKWGAALVRRGRQHLKREGIFGI